MGTGHLPIENCLDKSKLIFYRRLQTLLKKKMLENFSFAGKETMIIKGR